MTSPGGRPRDLRDLPPPRPLEIVLDEVARLEPGAIVHVVLVHEPAPLFALLPARGIAWACRVAGEGEVHVACWREGDAAAELRAQEALR